MNTHGGFSVVVSKISQKSHVTVHTTSLSYNLQNGVMLEIKNNFIIREPKKKALLNSYLHLVLHEYDSSIGLSQFFNASPSDTWSLEIIGRLKTASYKVLSTGAMVGHPTIPSVRMEEVRNGLG